MSSPAPDARAGRTDRAPPAVSVTGARGACLQQVAAAAIGAIDHATGRDVEVDPWMSERAPAAVAGDHRVGDGDDLGRFLELGHKWVPACAARWRIDPRAERMIANAAPRSTPADARYRPSSIPGS